MQRSNCDTELPIVLVHGTCGMSEDWSHVLSILSERCRVIRPNYGARISAEAVLNGPSVSDFVGGVIAEVRDAGIERFDLVGSSLGAAVAIGVASSHPELVNSLVLQSGFALGRSPRMKLLFDVWLNLARTDRMTLTKLILASGFSREFLSALDETALEGIAQAFVASSDWSRIEQAIQADIAVDIREQAGRIKSPVLLVSARGDQIVPQEYGRDLAELLPHADSVEIDGGHLLFLEKPIDLARAIQHFCGAPEG